MFIIKELPTFINIHLKVSHSTGCQNEIQSPSSMGNVSRLQPVAACFFLTPPDNQRINFICSKDCKEK